MAANITQTNPRFVEYSQRTSKVLGTAIAALGLVVIVGWVLDIAALKSVLPGLATMKLNTALLFVLSGIALTVVNPPAQIGKIAAAATLVIAAVTLLEYIGGWNPGIDELFARDTLSVAQSGSYPGRMSVMTAVNFALVSVALLFLWRTENESRETEGLSPRLWTEKSSESVFICPLANKTLFAHVLTLAAFFISLLALVGYMYDVDSLYEITPFSSMALHTAMAFFALSLGILLANTNSILMRLTVSDSTAGVLFRRLIPAAILLPLILGWLRFRGQDLGLYRLEFGTALTTILDIVVFSAIVGWTASALYRIDVQRQEAEAARQKSVDELEMRVQERTAELARTNQVLAASEARFSGVLNTAHDAVISTDQAQRIILYNQGAERIFGYKAEEVIGQPLERLLPARFHQAHKHYVEDFGTAESDTRIMAPDRSGVMGQRKNGEEFPADVSISTLLLDGERIFTAVVRDATERARATEALAAVEKRFSLMVNSVQGYAIYMLDPDGKITTWNRSAERIMGYTQDEILGKHFSLFFTEEDTKQGEPQRMLEIAATEGHVIREGQRVRKDGSVFWAMAILTTIRDDDNRLLGFSEVTRDLTERKQAEDALRQSEALLNKVLEALPVGVWITNTEGIVTRFNPAANKIWAGATYAGIEGSGMYKAWWADTGKPIAADEWASARAVTRGETSLNEEIEIQAFDGTHKFILNSALPIRDHEDAPIQGVIIVNQDITNIKRAEARLRQYAEELERSNQELQMFAYTASHDLQEPLRKIQAFGDRLQHTVGDSLDAKAMDYLERMINASSRMRDLIQDLLAYSRITSQSAPFAPVDLGDLIQSICSDLEVAVKAANARIEITPLMTIDADKTQMRQLFQNLISNALKFRAPARPPIVRIKGRLLGPDTSSLLKKEQLQYEVTVSDNGIGFDNEYAERIFRMFQRLHGRSEYEGTGIGLAVCHKIVERHGGTIIAHATPGQGATFTITLPMKQKQPAEEFSV